MDFEFAEDQRRFREELRAFLEAEVPPERQEVYGADSEEQYQFGRALARKLAARDWLAVGWPKEYGGGGRSQIEQAILSHEMGYWRAPRTGTIGLGFVGPALMKFGTDDQKKKYVPDIARGEAEYCQGFSEPNAGSDLASLQCRAERDGDEWVITGQKVWTSGGQVADRGMLLARTDPDQPKHAGISWFAFDMDQPGVEVRPLTEMTGRALFNEVFIDEARVADSALIGGLNNGWRVANTTLMVERASLGSSGRKPPEPLPGPKGGVLNRRAGDFAGTSGAATDGVPPLGLDLWWWLVGLARENGAITSRVLRDDLMRLYGLIEINRLSIQRAKAGGSASAATPNIAKLTMSELTRSFRDIGLRLIGADGMLMGDSDAQSGGHIAEVALFSPAPSIYGGTDQVQRNIIGERVLGLPREPGPPRDTPFSQLPKN